MSVEKVCMNCKYSYYRWCVSRGAEGERCKDCIMFTDKWVCKCAETPNDEECEMFELADELKTEDDDDEYDDR